MTVSITPIVNANVKSAILMQPSTAAWLVKNVFPPIAIVLACVLTLGASLISIIASGYMARGYDYIFADYTQSSIRTPSFPGLYVPIIALSTVSLALVLLTVAIRFFNQLQTPESNETPVFLKRTGSALTICSFVTAIALAATVLVAVITLLIFASGKSQFNSIQLDTQAYNLRKDLAWEISVTEGYNSSYMIPFVHENDSTFDGLYVLAINPLDTYQGNELYTTFGEWKSIVRTWNQYEEEQALLAKGIKLVIPGNQTMTNAKVLKPGFTPCYCQGSVYGFSIVLTLTACGGALAALVLVIVKALFLFAQRSSQYEAMT